MALLAFQHRVLDFSVAVPVHAGRVPAVRLGDNLPLDPSGKDGVGADVIGPAPDMQVFFDRLPVKKHDRDAGLFGFVDNIRRGRPVHQIDADGGIIPCEEPLDLVVLQRLVGLPVREIQRDFDFFLLFQLFCGAFQVAAQGRDEGVVLAVGRDADLQGLDGLLLCVCGAGGGGRRRQQCEDAYQRFPNLFHFFPPAQLTKGNRILSFSGL